MRARVRGRILTHGFASLNIMKFVLALMKQNFQPHEQYLTHDILFYTSFHWRVINHTHKSILAKFRQEVCLFLLDVWRHSIYSELILTYGIYYTCLYVFVLIRLVPFDSHGYRSCRTCRFPHLPVHFVFAFTFVCFPDIDSVSVFLPFIQHVRTI